MIEPSPLVGDQADKALTVAKSSVVIRSRYMMVGGFSPCGENSFLLLPILLLVFLLLLLLCVYVYVCVYARARFMRSASLFTVSVQCVCVRVQSLLTEWRTELARQPLAMSEADACAVLGLKPGPDGQVAEDELRRAYRGTILLKGIGKSAR
eukprot:1157956-Pelagomonas_calceolata.AAC.6